MASRLRVQEMSIAVVWDEQSARENNLARAGTGRRRAGNRDAQSTSDAHISALWTRFSKLAKDGEEGWETIEE